MQRLSAYRSEDPGLPDILNYGLLVDEGVVLNKDGSLIAGFRFRGDDAGSASDAEKNYLTEQVNNYLSRFDSGWAVWIDAIRTASPGYPDPSSSHFPDPISAMIDAERREMFEAMDTHFETDYAMVFQYTPPSPSKAADFFYNTAGEGDSSYADRVLSGFKKRMKDFEGGMRDLLHLRRMGTITVGEKDGYQSDELINYLHYCLTGTHLKLRIPDEPMFLDSWLGYESLYPGNFPAIGNKYIACIAISGFPGFGKPGLLSFLEELPASYRWSTRFIFMDQQEAISELNSFHRKWEQWVSGNFWSKVSKSGGGSINKDAASMTNEVNDALAIARSGKVAYGHYTPVIVVADTNLPGLQEKAAYIKKEVEHRGFHVRIEEENAMEAWHGTLPGHARQNIRRPFIHTLNLSDLMPTSSIWPGLLTNPCRFYPENSPPLMHAVTTGSTPLRINYHVDDVAHTLIFGPTGAGKSTILAMSIAQAMRYQSRRRPDGTVEPALIAALDKGHSLYALCSATGGTHYDLGADDSNALALCPLANIDSPSERIWAEEWIAICYEIQKGAPLTPPLRNEVHNAIVRLSDEPRNARSISHFISQVQDEDVRETLIHYSNNGSMGRLLDGEEDTLKVSNFTVFEIDELTKMGDKNFIPVMLYIFRKIEKSLRGQPAFMFIDEAWVSMGHQVMKEKLREHLKELRRANCGLIAATQSLSDANNSGILDVLMEQCPTKIFLPNKEADKRGAKGIPGPAELYAAFGLNEREIQMLKSAQYKRQYYYTSPLGRRMFELGIGPLALSFVGISDRDGLREVKAYEKEYGLDWPLYWLQKNGVDYERYIA